MPRTRPTPFKSDPTPAFGVPSISRGTLEEEFARAHQKEDDARYRRMDEDMLQERRKKALPIMILLLMLAALAGAWAVWSLFFKD
jgi:hypothetical protein